MKVFQIVGTLTAVVVAFTLLVFAVEGVTTPIIDKANAEKANAAKIEVLPTLVDYESAIESNFADYEVGDTGITDIFVIPDYGYVYMAQFQGYQSIIEYMIGVNEDGEVTGYVTLQQGDTPGLGAEIANEDNWTQFAGKSITDVQTGNFDGLSGATVTTNGWKGSLAKVLDFHNNEMLGFEVFDVTNDLDLPASITKVELITDGENDLEYVYTVEFESQYSAGPNIYQVVIDVADGSVKKLVVLEATDSDGIGAAFGEAEFAVQFKGMTQQDALDGNYDEHAGASFPITMSAFTETFEAVIMTHKVEIEGYVIPVETEAERLIRLKEEISIEDAIFTDVTADYTLPDGTVITKIETANDGTNDVALIVTFEFTGYNQAVPIQAMVGFDLAKENVIGFRVIDENDTPGLGGEIDNDDFMAQFEDANYLALQYGVFDGLAGATVTTNALVDAFDGVVSFYRADILGEAGGNTGELTEAQLLQQKITTMFPDAFSINDVTTDYTLKDGVRKVLAIKDIDGQFLGHVTITKVSGYIGQIEFLLGFNADNTFAGFSFLSDTETPGKADPYYEASFADLFTDVAIDADDYGIDAVAGSTETHGALMGAVLDTAKFVVEEVQGNAWKRPALEQVDQATLEAAYPGTNLTFNSIYATLPYDETIGNVFEVKENDVLIGHVYVGLADGNSSSKQIKFAWGVNLAGTTQKIEVYSDGETWSEVVSCGEHCFPSYDGSQGIFPNTTWLDTNFEGVVLADILTNAIDDIAGVSTTTSGMRDAAETIAQYHSDNSVGGGS